MEKDASVTKEKVRNYICDDLAFYILSKLPLKSLKRFGCVRKSWILLFENHHFMSIFRNNLISYDHSYYDDTSLLLQLTNRDLCSFSGDNFGDNFDDVIIDLPDPFKDEHPSIRVLDSGSITGILCLYTGDLRYALWNPTTEEFKIIPQLPREFDSPYITEEVIPLGFGFDQVRNDFKLITNVLFCLQYEDIDYPEFSCEYRIYNLKSNSWRKIDKDVGFISSFYTQTCQRLYMNGMCHWWVFSHDGRDITSFDLVTEEIITTHIPLEIHPEVNDDFNVAYIPLSLMVLNGSIGFISGPLDNTTFNIYILGEIGAKESWTKLFTIGPLSDIRLSIGAGKKGDLFFQKEDGDIVRFNLTTQLIEELDIEGDNYSILIYKKSFQSLI
ncbi:F-box/kelch-repeat protein At3g06240-like [Cicer arietinum]|uniref:F-box/kelch-repeat protein At3g06240-like n=1 Tax=Cicer arietinum TaxID=3827 RepID=A0A1S2XW71_CICAR|nr:F-box/kelch-repeat protein At3g06240-like [Cicer arietinum]